MNASIDRGESKREGNMAGMRGRSEERMSAPAMAIYTAKEKKIVAKKSDGV